MAEKDLLWLHAKDVLRRYDKEDFDIDGQVAQGISTAESIGVSGEKDRGDGYGEPKNLVLTFTNSVSDFRQALSNPQERRRASVRLSNAYDLLRNAGAIRDGRATTRRLAQKDVELRKLEEQLQETTKKLGIVEERLRDCTDEKVGLENKVTEQKEKLDNMRSRDIKDSLGSAKSKTEENSE